MAQPDLDRLLILNLADLDAAAQRVDDELSASVADTLNKHLEALIQRTDWAGVAKWPLAQSFWFAPKDWRKLGDNPREEYACNFLMAVSLGKGTAKDRFWLTQLVGKGDRNLGLAWIRSGVGKPQWRRAVAQRGEEIAKLRSRGFEYEATEGSFFLPVHIDQSTLAQGFFDESLEIALKPLADALQVCVEAKPDFDALIAATGGVAGAAAVAGGSAVS